MADIGNEKRKEYGSKELEPAGKCNLCLSYGPYAVVQAACRKAECLEPLQRAFPVRWRWILALCVHAIAEENTTVQAFPGGRFSKDCGMETLAGSEISQLYKDLCANKGNIQVFFVLYHSASDNIFPTSGCRGGGIHATNQKEDGRGVSPAKSGYPPSIQGFLPSIR
ncbi:MAG: hypothetical protein IJS84_09220, partial [Spirochaetales bacterium]|nr:hypothetical protein [Spirochaetales bacterium]